MSANGSQQQEMPATVIILDQQFPVRLPNFAAREDLVDAAVRALNADNATSYRRVCAAALALCSSLGPLTGADYKRSGFDVLDYGGVAYSYLREKGATLDDIYQKGQAVIVALRFQLWPRKPEVDEMAGFTEAAEGDRT